MSELALNSSETRRGRDTVGPNLMRPLVLSAIGAGALAGFAMIASSIIGDLVGAPVKPVAPAIDQGLASNWPDLKDGLPVIVGTADRKPIAVTETRRTVEPPRMVSLSSPPATIPGLSPPGEMAASVPPAPMVRQVVEAPVKRIPVPADVAVNPPPVVTKVVMPSRMAALIAPRETLRAHDETPPPRQEAVAKPRDEAPQPSPKAIPTKPREVVAEKRPVTRPVATVVSPPATKQQGHNVAAARKPAATTGEGAKPTVVANAAEPEETSILGVKLPSLAPAGRKIREGVTALRDAVREAF